MSKLEFSCHLTLVVTECVVGGAVDVVVVLDRPGFQISNCQKAGSVMGADSASVRIVKIDFIH